MPWVCLNDEGKKIWEDIFPDGKISVLGFSFTEARLTNGPEKEKVVLVNWKSFSKSQQNAVEEKISKLSGVSPEYILKDIEKRGLPMREKYTTGVIAEELRYFI